MPDSLLMPALAGLLACLSMLALAGGASGLLRERRRRQGLRRRLAGGRGGPAQDPGQTTENGLASAVRRLGERVGPSDQDEARQGRLSMIRAGLSGPRALGLYWGVRCALAAIGLAVGAVAVRLSVAAPQPAMALSAVAMTGAAMAGFYLPGLWLRLRTAARRTRLLHALPDALDLLVVCVESGMGLDQALARVGREMRLRSPDLALELNQMNLELRAGRRRVDALRGLAQRMNLDDVTSLVTLLVQADAFGTSVAGTLRVYSDTLRTRRRQRAEEMAAKLPVKLLFPLVLFILPALFVVIIGPAAIQLADIFSKTN